MSCTHIIGAGLAGLAGAVALAAAGRQVRLYDAGPAAAGPISTACLTAA